MLKRSILAVASLSLVLMCGYGAAAENPDTTQLRKALEQLLPNAKPDSITPSPIKGIYEVVYGSQLFYMTDDGRYILQGNLFDAAARKDISEPRRAAVRVQAVNSIGEDKMIVFAPKEGVKHTITVFTDPDCPYCRKLHKEVGDFNRLGIKVRYLLYPRAGKGSPTYDKSVSVWCAKDRNEALTQAKAGNEIDKKTCNNPVDKHMDLGEMMGITGTPTIVLEDGRILPGYVPAGQLAEILNAHKQ